MKKLIMVPYANIESMRGGVNIKDQQRVDIYLKNCCVSLLSAKHYNQDCDVALVTNIEIPDEYGKVLREKGIMIIKAEFDAFKFPDEYKWGLAFYKLCALKHILDNYDYDLFSYIDTDVYIQSNFDNIWQECRHNLLLYDINHGLQVNDYKLFLRDIKSFLNSDKTITQFGGEFLAGSKENCELFIEECHRIYMEMIDKGFTTSFGDEFIISQAADKNRSLVKNAGAYVFRYWTGTFRLVSTCYKFNPITVIHVPGEKKSGMVKIYDYYIKNKQLPTNEKYIQFYI